MHSERRPRLGAGELLGATAIGYAQGIGRRSHMERFAIAFVGLSMPLVEEL